MLQVICGWCGKLIELVDTNEEGISHGICASCRKKYKEQIKKGEVKDVRIRKNA